VGSWGLSGEFAIVYLKTMKSAEAWTFNRAALNKKNKRNVKSRGRCMPERVSLSLAAPLWSHEGCKTQRGLAYGRSI